MTMNVLSAQYYAERIASDCGAIHWLGSADDSAKAKDASDYLAAQLSNHLEMLAKNLGYRIEKVAEPVTVEAEAA